MSYTRSWRQLFLARAPLVKKRNFLVDPIRAANALESLIELAEVPEEQAQAILGQLRAADVKAGRRGSSKPQEPTPEPAAPALPSEPKREE